MPEKTSCIFTQTENKGADQLRIHWETNKALKQWQLDLSLNNSFSNFEFSNFLCWTQIDLLSYKSSL